MALIDWSPEYSVKIKSIDEQHQKLFKMINELHAAMMSGSGTAAAPGILKGLIAYTREHFSGEELLMKQSGYPRYTEHKAEHDKLTAEVIKMAQDFESGKTRISVALLSFLRQWLINHIQKTDQQYSVHLQGAGVR